MPMPSVSIVVPALNEAANIPHVFVRLPPDIHEVLLVDGHSVDDTIAVARQLKPDVRIVTQTRTSKGNALACGVAVATGDIIAMVDADGSADPGEIPRFVKALLDGADFAKGTRFAKGGGSSDITCLRSLGNSPCPLVQHLLRRRYTDLCYGFNVFWRRHTPVLGLTTSRPRSTATGCPGATGSRWRRSSTFAPPRPVSSSPRSRASSTRGFTATATYCLRRWQARAEGHSGRAAPNSARASSSHRSPCAPAR